MKRHEILGRKMAGKTKQALQNIDNEFAAFAEHTAPGQRYAHVWRESNLNACVMMTILEHLGYGPVPGLAERLNYGMDWALEYFFGDWYSDEDTARDLSMLPEPRRLLLTRNIFWQALYLGGLTGRWSDVEKIGGWFHEHCDLKSHGEVIFQIPDTQLQLAIALSLAPTPLAGAETLAARIQQDSDPNNAHLRLLCTLWQAATAKDQAGFERALKEKLQYFFEKQTNTGPDQRYWVDLYASSLWLLAERNGLVFPLLSDKEDAALIRRETVGLVEGVDPRPVLRDQPPGDASKGKKNGAAKKRHEILGRELCYTVEKSLGLIEGEFQKFPDRISPGKPSQSSWRSDNIGMYIALAALEHLGYGPLENLAGRLNQGMDWVLEYFFGDWDRHQSKASYQGPVPYDEFPGFAMGATDVLQHAVILGALTDRWDDVAKIGDWYQANLDFDKQLTFLEPWIDSVFWFAVGTSLANTPSPGTEAALAKVRGTKRRASDFAPPSCAVWDAMLAKDQKAFDKALQDRLRFFFKEEESDAPNWKMWISIETSVLWLIAERHGLAFPKLRDKQDAAVLRRQTVGLPLPADRSPATVA